PILSGSCLFLRCRRRRCSASGLLSAGGFGSSPPVSELLRSPRLFLVPLLFALACTAPRTSAPTAGEGQAPASAEPIRLTLVGTNDLHGWLEPHRATLPDGSVTEQGGLAVFAGYLDILRRDNPDGVVLLDGGDIFQGTLASNLTEGAVMVKAMNALGYDAAALGNHEFDYGPVGPVSVAGQGEDPFGALKARMSEAEFPILAANVYDAKSGAAPGWLDGTRIIERKGVKIGLLGPATPHTPRTTNPVNVASLRFGSMAPTAKEVAARLREQGAHVVVAVVHEGGRCRDLSDPRDLSSCDLEASDLFAFLRELPIGTLDAVIAGHTHAPVGHFINGTPVIETSGLGRSFGMIELVLDPDSLEVIPAGTRILGAQPICAWVDAETRSCDARVLRDRPQVTWEHATFLDQKVVPDEALRTMVAPTLERVVEEQARELGIEVATHLGRNYSAESDLGNVLAAAVRGAAGADVAIRNSGGLRADLEPGPLTFGEIYDVLPFDNTLSTVQVDTPQLVALLTAAYEGHKGVFQLSGLKVELEACNGPGRVRTITLP